MDPWFECQRVFNEHKYFNYQDLQGRFEDCNLVEDWGCGNLVFKSYFRNSLSQTYVGIDSPNNPIADRHEDFMNYRYSSSLFGGSNDGRKVGILLNNNLRKFPYWKRIFINALESDAQTIACIVPDNMINDVKNIMKIYRDFVYVPFRDNCLILLRHEGSRSTSNSQIQKNGRLAVCSIILHDYDAIKDVSKCPYDDVDFFMFTDNRELYKDDSKGWTLLDATYHLNDTWLDIGGLKSLSKDSTPNVVCKYYKTCVHRIPELQEYSRICVIDASLEITDFSILKMSPDPIVFHRHPYRSDIVSEAKAATFFYRYAYQPVVAQADSYMSEQYPNDYLLASGYYVRDNDPKINRAFELWYLEIQKWTDLCQLSLLYSFWICSMPKPYLLPDDIFSDKYLHFHHHKFNY